MGKSSKQKTTNEPSAYAKGYITPAAASLGSAYTANQPQIQGTANALWGKMPGMIAGAFTPSDVQAAATGNFKDVLGGNYLNGNQYLDGMISKTANDVTDRVNSTFGRSGRTGGDQHAQVLSRELANSENSMRYDNYAAERQRMMQAMGWAPQLEAMRYSGIAPTLAAYQAASGVPIDSANAYAGGTGNLLGQYNEQNTKTTPSLGSQFGQFMGTVGKAAQTYSTLFSDRRLKVNIEAVGALDDGLGVYDYDYVWGGARQRGVMADEVAVLRPWALGPQVSGFATVNYGAL